MSPSESGAPPSVKAAVLGDSIVASTMSSATCTPRSRSSAAAACVSARVANAPAAHSPRPGIARRDDPPVTCTSVRPPPTRPPPGYLPGAPAAVLEQRAGARRQERERLLGDRDHPPAGALHRRVE